MLLNFTSDTSYKRSRFSKTPLKKSLEFVLSGKYSTIIFNFSFVLLVAEVNFILNKQCFKKNVFVTDNFSHIKIVFILLIKIVVLDI